MFIFFFCVYSFKSVANKVKFIFSLSRFIFFTSFLPTPSHLMAGELSIPTY